MWVGTQVRSATAVRERWGPTVPVLVATSALAPGEVPNGDGVRTVDWPAALAPTGALEQLPRQRALGSPVPAGQVLVSSQFAEPRRGPWAAQLDRDEAAVRVPLPAPLSGLTPGDRVDVVAAASGAVDPFEVPDTAHGAQRVAGGARVLQVEPDGVVLAVPVDSATDTAAAALGGSVTLVVRP
jgi:Flp pilus assembly protein CpaB